MSMGLELKETSTIYNKTVPKKDLNIYNLYTDAESINENALVQHCDWYVNPSIINGVIYMVNESY